MSPISKRPSMITTKSNLQPSKKPRQVIPDSICDVKNISSSSSKQPISTIVTPSRIDILRKKLLDSYKKSNTNLVKNDVSTLNQQIIPRTSLSQQSNSSVSSCLSSESNNSASDSENSHIKGLKLRQKHAELERQNQINNWKGYQLFNVSEENMPIEDGWWFDVITWFNRI